MLYFPTIIVLMLKVCFLSFWDGKDGENPVKKHMVLLIKLPIEHSIMTEDPTNLKSYK